MIHLDQQALRNKAIHQTLIWIFIGTIFTCIIKFLWVSPQIERLLVEFFIMGYILLYLLIDTLVRINHKNKESKASKLEIVFFYTLIIGAFFIHHYSLLKNYKTQFFYPLTGIFLTLGMMMLMIQLKRKNIYFHIELLNKDHYLLQILKHILRYTVIFSIFYVLLAFQKDQDLTVGLILSYGLFTITHLMFSIYEKFHYEENMLIKNNVISYMSKTVVLFLLLQTVFMLFDFIFNHFIQYHIIFNQNQVPQYIKARMYINWIQVHFFLYVMIAWVQLYRHLKKLKIDYVITRWVLFGIFIVFLSFVYSFGINFFISFIIDTYYHEIGTIGAFLERITQIGIAIYFLMTATHIIIWYRLRKYHLKGQIFYTLSIIVALIHFFGRNISLMQESKVLFIGFACIGFIGIPLLFIFLCIQTKSRTPIVLEETSIHGPTSGLI